MLKLILKKIKKMSKTRIIIKIKGVQNKKGRYCALGTREKSNPSRKTPSGRVKWKI